LHSGKKILILIFLIYCGIEATFAQVPFASQQIIEDLIEEIAQNTDEELDYTTLFNDLDDLLNNPLDINSATREDLEKLHILTDFQINNLISYRYKHGDLLTIYELQMIEGFTKDIIEKIMPFIRVGSLVYSGSFPKKESFIHGKSQLFIRGQQVIEEQKGFSEPEDSADTRYSGSPLKLYFRYKYEYSDKLMWGVTAEKDAGEEFLKGSQKYGFDYYSCHLQVNDIGPVKKLMLGDYQAQFGQGLVLWSGMSFGKSAYVLNINKRPQGVRYYSSTDENIFMRGVATTVQIKNIDITGFYSGKNIDANITDTDSVTGYATEVSSLQNTGLHATPAEIYDKDAIGVTVMGGNITYNQNICRLGLTLVHYKYSAEIIKDTLPYNQYDFRGSENTNAGLDYRLAINKVNFFGEAAVSGNNAIAFINGISLSVIPEVSFSLLHRSYQRDYQAYYSNGFSENTKTANEDGIYLGTVIYPVKNWKLTAYYDNFHFPWLKYGVDAPSNGFDLMAQADYFISENVQMYWRFRQEKKPENTSTDDSSLNGTEDVNKLKARYHISYKVLNSLLLKNRVEWSGCRQGKEEMDHGYLVYQDISYRIKKVPLSVSLRYALFDTDSWDTRIYAYENDVLYGFSFPTYYYRGSRFYIVMNYKIMQGLDLWLRYSITGYTDRDVIGSGLTEIQGSTKSEVKVQVRFKF